MSRLTSGTWLACGVLALGACASVPPPRDEIARADAAVARAKTDQVAADAPLPLRKAEEKLERAKTAMREEHNVEARRLAEQSKVDADLATATADRARTEKLSNELDQTVQALREEVSSGNP